MSRRALLLGLLALPGCGFRPLYGPQGLRPAGDAAAEPALLREMAAVRVARIPERSGQLLRRHLQGHLEDRAPGTPARYELQAALSARGEVMGFRRDGSVTRVRTIATVDWVLVEAGPPPAVIGRGQARTLDAHNIPDLQFFAADAARLDLDRRVIAELGDQVVLAVAAALRRRLAA